MWCEHIKMGLDFSSKSYWYCNHPKNDPIRPRTLEIDIKSNVIPEWRPKLRMVFDLKRGMIVKNDNDTGVESLIETARSSKVEGYDYDQPIR